MQYVFRRNRLAANPRFSESQVFGNRWIKVMTHHKHVEMLVNGVDCVWHGRIGRGRQKVIGANDFQHVGGMTTTCAFSVKRAQSAPFGRSNRVFNKARFVQRVRVNRHLHVVLIGNVQTVVDGSGCGAPIFV